MAKGGTTKQRVKVQVAHQMPMEADDKAVEGGANQWRPSQERFGVEGGIVCGDGEKVVFFYFINYFRISQNFSNLRHD